MQEIEDTSAYAPGRFPNPTVQSAYILSGDVENEDGSTTVHNVLSSSSGMFYKFSVVIKKAIYGLVVKGLVLRPTESGTYVRTGEVVALKVCSKDVLQRIGGATLENPITEIGAMQALGLPRHPNLPLQYECCMDEKNIYSVLQYHKGVELFDHILNHGPLTESVARVVFQQLTLALYRLHQQDIAHRDVSLENIMYDSNDHAAVLIDFGLCVKLQRDSFHPDRVLPVRNSACGKAYYMPPEVDWNGDHPAPINPILSDIWSTGMCLLYALLGFPPIERACSDDVRFNYLISGRLPELLEHWEVDLSPACVDLIQMILRLEPGERPSLAQIWQHSWMQQDGLSMPHAAQLAPEEVKTLTGPLFTSHTSDKASSGSLAPLQHPSAVSADDSRRAEPASAGAAMSISCDDADDASGGESPEAGDRHTDCTTRDCESYRSSVDSHWSAATTPTGRSFSSSSSYSIMTHHYAASVQAVGAATPIPLFQHINSGTTTVASSSSSSSSGVGSPYYTRSRASTPHSMMQMADTPTGGAVSNGAQSGSPGGTAKGNSNNSNDAGGFRVIHTRSMALGKSSGPPSN
jgi:serine/threonine protein kinase